MSFRLLELINVAGFWQLVKCFSITTYCYLVRSKFSCIKIESSAYIAFDQHNLITTFDKNVMIT